MKMRNSTHLMEMSEILMPFNLKEGDLLRGFDPKGLFSEHLASIRYSNLFTRISKGTGDSNPNTLMKKEKHVCNDDLVMEVSTNTPRQNRAMQRGKDRTNVQSSSIPHSRRSSSSTQKKHEENVIRGENNEGRAGGDDGEDSPLVNIEKAHDVSQQKKKRIPIQNDSQN